MEVAACHCLQPCMCSTSVEPCGCLNAAGACRWANMEANSQSPVWFRVTGMTCGACVDMIRHAIMQHCKPERCGNEFYIRLFVCRLRLTARTRRVEISLERELCAVWFSQDAASRPEVAIAEAGDLGYELVLCGAPVDDPFLQLSAAAEGAALVDAEAMTAPLIALPSSQQQEKEKQPQDGATELCFLVQGMRCAGCVAKIETAMSRVPNVNFAAVNLLAKTVRVSVAAAVQPAQLLNVLHDIGFDGTPMAAPSALVLRIVEGTLSEVVRAQLSQLPGVTAVDWNEATSNDVR